VEAWVVNLPHRTDRWHLQQVQARLHGLTLRRFAATPAEHALEAHPGSSLSGGELGLLESIDRLLLEIRGRSGWVLVLEDDAVLKPGFRRRMRGVLPVVPESAWLVQAGYLTESSPRPDRTALQNLHKFLRPRSRYRRWRSGGHVARSGPFTGALVAGTQVLAVRADHVDAIRGQISYRLPWDKEIQRWAVELPGTVVTPRTSVAWQLPVQSDIRGHTPT
jgi:hypothetical protein